MHGLKIMFFIMWGTFKLYCFNQSGKGMDLIGGIIILTMALIAVLDFFESYKKMKVKRRTNEMSI